MDLSLEDIIEKIYELKDVEATILARKVLQDWQQGVIPSRKTINILLKYLETDTPCARLSEDGICMGWLKRNQSQLDFAVNPPYFCPFSDIDGKKPNYRQCPGYRKS